VKVVEFRGKGSHARLYFGTRSQHRSKKLPKGLLKAMCRQLGIDPTDLEA
jgi:predicted RNA binding protein YcfA (HicA-like mRNA interferase family)